MYPHSVDVDVDSPVIVDFTPRISSARSCPSVRLVRGRTGKRFRNIAHREKGGSLLAAQCQAIDRRVQDESAGMSSLLWHFA